MQKGQDGSENSTIFIGAFGLPRMWSLLVTGRILIVTWSGCAVLVATIGVGRFVQMTAPATSAPAIMMAIGTLNIGVCFDDSILFTLFCN